MGKCRFGALFSAKYRRAYDARCPIRSPGGQCTMFESDTFREVWAPRLLSIVRIFLGLLYLQHGLSKYFGFPAPAPQNFQMLSLFGLAGAIEIIGSLMLTLGLYTRWAAFMMS